MGVARMNSFSTPMNIHGLRNIIPRLKKACHWN